MKRYLTTLILWATLLLGELHTFWENSTKKENWILTRYVLMPIQWNVKLVTDEAVYIIIFAAMWFYRKNRVNDTTVLTFILFSIIDTGMYFYNYKTYGFGIVYVLFLVLWVVIYNTYGRRSNTKNGQGVITKT